VWIAGEIAMVRALRDHLIGQRGLPRAQVKAAGYWKAGEPGAHTKLED
jgi:NADPH-dependent ferric siderophore reductase